MKILAGVAAAIVVLLALLPILRLLRVRRRRWLMEQGLLLSPLSVDALVGKVVVEVDLGFGREIWVLSGPPTLSDDGRALEGGRVIDAPASLAKATAKQAGVMVEQILIKR